MVRRRIQHGSVTWLACLALALILFAPSVSRLLACGQGMPAMAMDCIARGAHAAPPIHHGQPDAPNPDEPCGYCTLMCHTPALTSGIVLTVPALPAVSWSVPAPRLDPPLPALLDRRSRGPPAV